MLILDNFVHTDLHPGNIMVKFTKPLRLLENIRNRFFHEQLTGSGNISSSIFDPLANSDSDKIVSTLLQLRNKPAQWHAELERLHRAGYIPEIIFLDAGLVTVLSATNQRNLLDLFHSLVEFDGFHVGQLMIERSRSPELALDPDIFALKIEHVILDVKRKTFSLGQITSSDLLSRVLKNVRKHHVKLEGDFTNVIVSFLILEGVGRQLNPNLDIFSRTLPILRQLGGLMASQENMGMKEDMPRGHLSVLLKVWVWVEARSLISSAIADADEMIKYDWCVWSLSLCFRAEDMDIGTVRTYRSQNLSW